MATIADHHQPVGGKLTHISRPARTLTPSLSRRGTSTAPARPGQNRGALSHGARFRGAPSVGSAGSGSSGPSRGNAGHRDHAVRWTNAAPNRRARD